MNFYHRPTNDPPTMQIFPYDCDVGRGDLQCPARLKNGKNRYSFCRFVAGHPGPHKKGWNNGEEWEDSDPRHSILEEKNHEVSANADGVERGHERAGLLQS